MTVAELIRERRDLRRSQLGADLATTARKNNREVRGTVLTEQWAYSPNPEPFAWDLGQEWYRDQSRAVQLPIAVLAWWGMVHHLTRTREPGEPHQAFLLTLLIYAALFVAAELLRPKPAFEAARPAGLGDFQFPTATEGRVVPLVWGRIQINGPNVVWYGDLSQEAITEEAKTGLFSSTTFTKGHKYKVGIQFALCRGPVSAIKRVWIGEDEVFTGAATSTLDIDKPELFGGENVGGNGGIQTTMDVHLGTLTQAPNAYLQRFQIVAGATDPTPRYTGTCYLVARELNSTPATARGAYVGNSATIKPWSFELERYPSLFGTQGGVEHIVGVDANPMNVAYELLTNDEWGFGFLASDIDLGNFKTEAATIKAEANGMSMILDSAKEATAILEEIERQIDGVFFLDHRTGKWKVKLARDDYDINTVPQFTKANVKEVRDFTRSSWEDTTNSMSLQYNKRDDDYKQTFAVAQDTANTLIRGDGTVTGGVAVSAQIAYPGVKVSTLAATLVWRDLRTVSSPLARAEFVVNREFWDLTIGSVVAWTNADFGFVKLPMRITKIDYGRLDRNEISVTAVQDIFRFAAASYGPPPATGWVPPSTTLAAYAAAQQLGFEAPRAFVVRDPLYAGDDTVSKVWAGARLQGNETGFDITERHDPVSPGGSYADAGFANAFMRIGELNAALGAGTAVPTATITVTPTPDSQAAIEEVFQDGRSLLDLGQGLAQLIWVGDETAPNSGEFMLVQSAADNGGNVDLQNVYRGVLDSFQRDHASGTSVFLIFVGGGITSTNFPVLDHVDIELRMLGFTGVRFAGSVNLIDLQMSKRPRRPYSPSEVQLNSTRYGTPSLEGAGSGLNGFRIDVDWLRRRFDTGDELAEMLADQAVTASTEYQVEFRAEPAGANTLIETKAFTTGTGTEQFNRTDILEHSTGGVAGVELRAIIRARHDTTEETNIVSLAEFFYDFIPTSALTSQFAFGVRATNVATAQYTAAATGTFTVNIGAAYPTGLVEVNVNSGGFVTVIAATLTTGTFSASSGETIEFRHTVLEGTSPNFLELENPSASAVAYGIFID